jgi:hypothetical protein
MAAALIAGLLEHLIGRPPQHVAGSAYRLRRTVSSRIGDPATMAGRFGLWTPETTKSWYSNSSALLKRRSKGAR